ncbi:MAG: maleylpyruvate isomerase N-terminal domain-containing protein [Candidatus Dormibacteraeota bacterium]|nr:maleylpyruvate isomerase N-terminal domain-containing protein [Candidatus Dormibacteraeota bacterium]
MPEWSAFEDVMTSRRPDHGTACEAWTVRDIAAHQAGNAEELARVLRAHLSDDIVPPTRSFEQREPVYRSMNDVELHRALVDRMHELAQVGDEAVASDGAAFVPWTGRRMRVRWFLEHMREELVIHRWDIAGDDDLSTAFLSAPWFTEHSVLAVGQPLLMRGYERWSGERVFSARLRSETRDDVVVSIAPDGPNIKLAPPAGDAVLETDPAARALLIWGRRPADCTRIRSDAGFATLGATRRLLSGY